MRSETTSTQWIVCQIGAREHYAIPRALDREGCLKRLYTDFWVEPSSLWAKLPKSKKLADRFHEEISSSLVKGFNTQMIGGELRNRLNKTSAWQSVLQRNFRFQRLVIDELKRIPDSEDITVFSYSYAAKEIFKYAKSRGWGTVLGQIDPGIEEEHIVSDEHELYSKIESCWEPAPSSYWKDWREEVDLADRIIVNSEWSQQCLENTGVAKEKMEIIPLVYMTESSSQAAYQPPEEGVSLKVLFLGQILLRKGVGRLLDAFKLLEDEPFELILAGNTEIDPRTWAHMSNVSYIGSLPRSEVEKAYREADVFVLPTLSDGYALTQLEALACGLPVVASKNCGAAVLDGENGIILENLEADTIASTLRSCRVRSFNLSAGVATSFTIQDLGRVLNRNHED